MAGALGLRPQKVALGPVVGAAVGAAWRLSGGSAAPPAVVAAATVAAYRAVSAVLFRDRPGEPAGRAGRAPRTCRSWCRLSRAPAMSARATSASWPACWVATYRRDAADVGIVASLDELAGPQFDPAQVGSAGSRVLRAHHPVPARHRARVAAVGAPGLPALPHASWPGRSGQANVPMNQREALRGVRSRIDTITPDGDRRARRPRVDPFVRRHRRADLRRHLHDLPARGPRLRQRRVSRCRRPTSPRRCCPCARPGGGLVLTSRSELGPARPLPDLHRLRDPRPDDAGRARFRRASSTSSPRRGAARRARVLGSSGSRSWCCTTRFAASLPAERSASERVVAALRRLATGQRQPRQARWPPARLHAYPSRIAIRRRIAIAARLRAAINTSRPYTINNCRSGRSSEGRRQ